jgi:inner membrane protein
LIAGTHVAFATTLYLGGEALFEYEPGLISWALAAGASLLPDIDLPTSRLGRVFFFVSTRLDRDFGHRTIAHSCVNKGGTKGQGQFTLGLDPLEARDYSP